MSHRDLGIYIKQTLVWLQKQNICSSKLNSVEAVINNLQKIPGVESVTTSTSVPGSEVGGSSGFRMISSNEDKRCRTFGIDEKFIPDYNLSLVAGRNFDKDKPFTQDTTQTTNVIINETAAKIFGFPQAKNAINKIIVTDGNINCKIVVVLHDYHQQSLHTISTLLCITLSSLFT